MNFLLSYWKDGLLVLLCVGLVAVTHIYDTHTMQDKLDAQTEQYQRELIDAQSKAAQTVKNQQTATTQVSHVYQTQLADTNTRYNALLSRLRDTTAAKASCLSQLSGSTTRPDGTASTDGLSDYVVVKAVTLKNAQDNTDKLISLQEWVNKQFAVAAASID